MNWLRTILYFIFFVLSARLQAVQNPQVPTLNLPNQELLDIVWDYHLPDFSQDSYSKAVEVLFTQYETAANIKLGPGPRGKVGLKVFTASGQGLCTPVPLTKAVIQALERRGWKSDQIFILDQSEYQLRQCGYLPALGMGGGDKFQNKYDVYVLESDKYYDPNWFYDSPLPSLEPDAIYSRNWTATYHEGRKSYLPVPLMLDADYWINLPMVCDLQAIGVGGALANATLWAISNNQRFLQSEATAPVAVSEMSAIPELRERWIFTLMTWQTYQAAGGPLFNANYCYSEPHLLLSANPVLLDYVMLEKINPHRKYHKFPTFDPTPRMFDYCQSLGVGPYQGEKFYWRSTDNSIARSNPSAAPAKQKEAGT